MNKLFIVPTLQRNQLSIIDQLLIEKLAANYEITVFTEFPLLQGILPEILKLDLLWLRNSLARESTPPRLLFILRTDFEGAAACLQTAQRFSGVVLLLGASLFNAYQALYLGRDNVVDFSLELGKQLGESAPLCLQRIQLGLSSKIDEHRFPMLQTLSNRSVGIVTSEASAFKKLKEHRASNLLFSLPPAIPLPLGEYPSHNSDVSLMIFGEQIPSVFLELASYCKQAWSRKKLELKLIVSELSPTNRNLGPEFQYQSPTISLLQSSSAVLAISESKMFPSAVLSTCISAQAATMIQGPSNIPTLPSAWIALRNQQQSPLANELLRALEMLNGPTKTALQQAASETKKHIPSLQSFATLLSAHIEKCHFQRPEHPPALHVWKDVLGERLAELQSLSYSSVPPQANQETLEAAIQLQFQRGEIR